MDAVDASWPAPSAHAVRDDAPVVVVAMDKLKGSVTARQACAMIAAGITQVLPSARVVAAPIADGGDGTVAALIETGHRRLAVRVEGPTGVLHDADVAMSFHEGRLQAFVELANLCGLGLLPQGDRRPMRASTRGLGMALRASLDAGARRIGIGLGGSASTDGGLGMLAELGVSVRDRQGVECGPGASGLLAAASVDLSQIDPRVEETDWFVASDVDTPLLGPKGAARMFGPQKGLAGDDLRAVEAALGRWADLLEEATGRTPRSFAGAGAAGGVGFAAAAVLGATLRSGSAYVLDAVGLADQLAAADLVVTGQGRWDAQTWQGKGPASVLALARRSEVEAVVVAGSIAPGALAGAAIRGAHQLVDLEPDVWRAMRGAPSLLRMVGERIATQWADGPDRWRRTQ